MPPTVSHSKSLDIVVYENWDLDQLEGEFEIAAFERDIRQKHVKDIKEAVMANEQLKELWAQTG